MYLLGYSLDNLSLMGLTIAVGFVVDDAIVVIENIIRHVESGETPLRRRARGIAREVGFTVVSMTTSLIAVFIPVLLMSGIIGRLFREFAMTVGAAVVMSAVISLTVTPTMCAWLIRHQRARGARTRLSLAASACSTRCCASTSAGCDWVLAPSGAHAGRDARDAGRDDLLLRDHSQGLLPARGHRSDHRRGRGRARHLLRGNGGAHPGAWAASSWPIRMWTTSITGSAQPDA